MHPQNIDVAKTSQEYWGFLLCLSLLLYLTTWDAPLTKGYLAWFMAVILNTAWALKNRALQI